MLPLSTVLYTIVILTKYFLLIIAFSLDNSCPVTGRVTEFRYNQKIAWGIQNFDQLNGVYDPGWGMADPGNALVFVDNHDNQRGHGGAGECVVVSV